MTPPKKQKKIITKNMNMKTGMNIIHTRLKMTTRNTKLKKSIIFTPVVITTLKIANLIGNTHLFTV